MIRLAIFPKSTIAIAMMMLSTAHLRAAVAVFQQGTPDPFTGLIYSGTEDVTLSTNREYPPIGLGPPVDHGFENFGGSDFILAGNGSSVGVTVPAIERTLLRFDLRSFAGRFASIDAVTLRLRINQGSFTTIQAFAVTAANADWVEGDGKISGFDSSDVGASTWAFKLQGSTIETGVPWAGNELAMRARGLGTAGIDYATPSLASFTISYPISFVDLAFDDVSVVGQWAGGLNPGMLLRFADETAAADIFYSSESTYVPSRPTLIVSYTPVPEPGTLSLLCAVIGMINARKLRRR